MEPAHTIIMKLGGASSVAECLGIHRTRVSSWRLSKEKGGTDGRIPHWHIPKLMARAADMGVIISPSDFIVVLEFSHAPAQSLVGKVSIALAAVSFAILIGSAPVSRAEPSPMRADAGYGFWELAFTSDLVAIAKRDLGKTGPQLGLPSRLWCGDFINRVRRKAGLSVVPSRRAIDQAKHGKRLSRPVPGALLITHRRNGSHVDVIVAVHGDGTVTTIGGNVSKRVAERRRPARGIIIKPV